MKKFLSNLATLPTAPVLAMRRRATSSELCYALSGTMFLKRLRTFLMAAMMLIHCILWCGLKDLIIDPQYSPKADWLAMGISAALFLGLMSLITLLPARLIGDDDTYYAFSRKVWLDFLGYLVVGPVLRMIPGSNLELGAMSGYALIVAPLAALAMVGSALSALRIGYRAAHDPFYDTCETKLRVVGEPRPNEAQISRTALCFVIGVAMMLPLFADKFARHGWADFVAGTMTMASWLPHLIFSFLIVVAIGVAILLSGRTPEQEMRLASWMYAGVGSVFFLMLTAGRVMVTLPNTAFWAAVYQPFQTLCEMALADGVELPSFNVSLGALLRVPVITIAELLLLACALIPVISERRARAVKAKD